MKCLHGKRHYIVHRYSIVSKTFGVVKRIKYTTVESTNDDVLKNRWTDIGLIFWLFSPEQGVKKLSLIHWHCYCTSDSWCVCVYYYSQYGTGPCIWQWYIHSIKYWHATLCNLFQRCMLLISFPILTVSFTSDEMDMHSPGHGLLLHGSSSDCCNTVWHSSREVNHDALVHNLTRRLTPPTPHVFVQVVQGDQSYSRSSKVLHKYSTWILCRQPIKCFSSCVMFVTSFHADVPCFQFDMQHTFGQVSVLKLC
jgi:hypothetical protein